MAKKKPKPDPYAINPRQAIALRFIAAHPNADTNEVRENDQKQNPRAWESRTYDAIHAMLARMEYRKFIRRTNRATSGVATWDITRTGEKALARREKKDAED